MDLLVRNYWNRMFLLLDNMKEVRRMINTYTSDPTALPKIRKKLQQLSDNVRLMTEILGYLSEALEACEIPPEPLDVAGRALYDRLQIADLAGQLSMRVLDLKKNMDGASAELVFLRSLAGIVAENQSSQLVENLQTNTRQLMILHETNEKTSATVEILQYLGSAMFAFALIDRLIGPGWSVSESEYVFARYQDPEVWDKDLVSGQWQSFINAMIVGAPTMWFWISLAVWAAVLYGTNRMLQQMKFVSLGKMTVRVRIMQKLDIERFNSYIQTKVTALEERDFQENNSIIRVSWEEADREAWGGSSPYVVLEYDAETQFLHNIALNYNRRDAIKNLALSAPELRNKLCDEMLDAQVFTDPNFSFRENLPEDDAEFGEMKGKT
jgi:WD repeat-containing protein 35